MKFTLATGAEEGITLAVSDMDAPRGYCAWEVWGSAYRRPGVYGLLVEERKHGL